MNTGDLIHLSIIVPVLVFMLIGIIKAIRIWTKKAEKKMQLPFPTTQKRGRKGHLRYLRKKI
jgi:hypothetical protein